MSSEVYCSSTKMKSAMLFKWTHEIIRISMANDLEKSQAEGFPCGKLVYPNPTQPHTCMKVSHMAVVVHHHREFKPFPRKQRCKLQSFTQADFSVLEIDPTKLAHSLNQVVAAANIHRTISTPCLPLNSDETNNTSPKVEIIGGGRAPGVLGLVVETAIGMASGVDPIHVTNGQGGAYYLRNLNGSNIALVKPIDEEPLALNSSKGYAGRLIGHPGLKNYVIVSETAVREVAAYLLDHNGFAGVPPTALVKISHTAFHTEDPLYKAPTLPKLASIQRFIDHDFDAGDLGPSGFSVDSVHRIGILDIRLLNLDRHAGNILVKKQKNKNNVSCYGGGVGSSYVSENYAVGAAELVPIDHGLCLPELLEDPYFEWLHWPQAALPFSETEAEYICRLDPLKDAEILRTELPSVRESSIRILALCTIFLKRAVEAGLCLADIGDMMTREYCGTEQGPSLLEALCAKVISDMNNASFVEGFKSMMESEEDFNMFQFDIESEEKSTNVMDVKVPRLLRSHCNASKPPKVPVKLPFTRSMSEFSHKVLYPLHEDDNEDEKTFINDDSDDDEEENENKEEDVSNDSEHNEVGGLVRSVSYPETKHKHEIGSISFKEMSEEEWGVFLESFEKQLPKAFEDRKREGLKQRLGSSCKF